VPFLGFPETKSCHLISRNLDITKYIMGSRESSTAQDRKILKDGKK
jgi:hypothetical protein